MNVDSLSSSLSQSNILVLSNKKNKKDLNNLLDKYGNDCERHLIRYLFSQVDFSPSDRQKCSYTQQINLLKQGLKDLTAKANFCTTVCTAIDHPLNEQVFPSKDLVESISKILGLSKSLGLLVAIALKKSQKQKIRDQAKEFILKKLPAFVSAYIDENEKKKEKNSEKKEDESKLSDLNADGLHLLLSEIMQNSVIPEEDLSKFFSLYYKDKDEKDKTHISIHPLCSYDDLNREKFLSDATNPTLPDISFADILFDHGYLSCNKKPELKLLFEQYNLKNLKEAEVCKCISMMSETQLLKLINIPSYKTLGDAIDDNKSAKKDQAKKGKHVQEDKVSKWNIKVFLEIVFEKSPQLKFNDVLSELKEQLGCSFQRISNFSGVEVLCDAVTILQKKCNGETFSEFLLKPWKYYFFQFSVIKLCIETDECSYFIEKIERIVDVASLGKTLTSEDEQRDIKLWTNLNLVKCLLELSEKDQLRSEVAETFSSPMKKCPDIFVMALLQSTDSWPTLKSDCVFKLLQACISEANKAAKICTAVWNSKTTPDREGHAKKLVTRCMAEWFTQCQNKYDVLALAQETNSLLNLLDERPLGMVIKLAVLAFNKQFLALDVWISKKVEENGAEFVDACVYFLKDRLPEMTNSFNCIPDADVPPEIETILKVLQKSITSNSRIKESLSEEIKGYIQKACNVYLKPVRPATAPTIAAPSPKVTSTPIKRLNNQQLSNTKPENKVPKKTIQHIQPQLTQDAPNSLYETSKIERPFNHNPKQIIMKTSQPPIAPPPQRLQHPLPPRYISESRVSSSVPPDYINNQGYLMSHIPSNSQLPQMSMNNKNDFQNLDNPLFQREIPLSSTVDVSSNQFMTTPDDDFSKKMDNKINKYFGDLYNLSPKDSQSGINQMLITLEHLKNGDYVSSRTFECFMNHLFKEYNFLDKYPEKELQITAKLFGGIIARDLVGTIPLGLAMRYVLEALRKPPTSKLFKFGIVALESFKHKLVEVPDYTHCLASIPSYEIFPDSIKQQIQAIKLKVETSPDNNSSPNILNDRSPNIFKGNVSTQRKAKEVEQQEAHEPTIQPSLNRVHEDNIDTLLNTSVQDPERQDLPQPEDAVQKRVAFIFNNLSQNTMVQKAAELKTIVENNPLWLANYMVVKRVGAEPKFHGVYSTFLDEINLSNFTKLVFKELYRNIQSLLQFEKPKDEKESFSDRLLLKNLGHFLGVITIAKNKPIQAKHLDIRALLYEAWHKGHGESFYVIPFVAKIFESVKKSDVFKLPNPYTYVILSNLKEIWTHPKKKENLSFEVEVLFKTLEYDLLSHPASHYISNEELKKKIPFNKLSIRKKRSNKQSKPSTPSELPGSQPNPPVSEPNKNPGNQNPQKLPSPQLPTAKFSLEDIDGNNLISTLSRFVQINLENALFKSASSQTMQAVLVGIQQAISEIMPQSIDKARTLAVKATEQIARKDFSLDPDEDRLLKCATYMVRNLAAGMALTYCRDALHQSIISNLRNNLMTVLKMTTNSPPEYRQILEHTIEEVAKDNIDLACNIVQKGAVIQSDKYINDVLKQDILSRKRAKQEGRLYTNHEVLTYQAANMYDPIKLQVGGPTNQQMKVYEQFFNQIPGFINPVRHMHFPNPEVNPIKPIPQVNDEVIHLFKQMFAELDSTKQNLLISNSSASYKVNQLYEHLNKLVRNYTDISAYSEFFSFCFDGLVINLQEAEAVVHKFKLAYINVLRMLQDSRLCGEETVKSEITKNMVIHFDQVVHHATTESILLIVRCRLINSKTLDQLIAQKIKVAVDQGILQSNIRLLLLAIKILSSIVLEETTNPSNPSEMSFTHTIEVLNNLINVEGILNVQTKTTINQLMESIKSKFLEAQQINESKQIYTRVMHNSLHKILAHESRVSQFHSFLGLDRAKAKKMDDRPGFSRIVESKINEWSNIVYGQENLQKSYIAFIRQLQLYKVFDSDDNITMFFRFCTEYLVSNACKTLQEMANNHTMINPSMTRNKCYHFLDAYVELIFMIIKYPPGGETNQRSITCLNQILGVIIGVMHQDQEVKGPDFHQMPYQRIIQILFIKLIPNNSGIDSITFQYLVSFVNAFHLLRPEKLPGFAFAWLELVSYRGFLSKMLGGDEHNAQGVNNNIIQLRGMYSQVLLDLFKFIGPFLRNVTIPRSFECLYRGCLRLILILLHDFPEFLCDYHFSLCDFIPANCVQLRNLVLSAFPRHMRLPDPFTPNLKVNMLPEITQPPRILTSITAPMTPEFQSKLQNYLDKRSPVSFPPEITSQLQLSPSGNERYDLPLMNALVLYVGTKALDDLRTKGIASNISNISHTPYMDIFQSLSVDLDNEGRYLFLNAIANQLRYPNSHTHYFSCVLLYLFAEANSQIIQEQITRVLLERLIVNRPHPWGLLITFIELIKNPSFNFWQHDFVKCAPEITKLFESVAQSCQQYVPTSAAIGGFDQQPQQISATKAPSISAGNQNNQQQPTAVSVISS